jgi:hypothetical protein
MNEPNDAHGLTPAAMGRIVKRVRKSCLFIKSSSLCFLLSLCLFAADFWIVSSGGRRSMDWA